MARQTAVPGIIVNSIGVETQTSTKTMEFNSKPEDIDYTRLLSLLEQYNVLYPRPGATTIVYDLDVSAYNTTSAGPKARAFVRLKNPFEPNIIKTSEPRKTDDLGVVSGYRNVYNVRVQIEK